MKIVKRHEYKNTEGTFFEDESLTQQQYLDECNIVMQIDRLTKHLNTTGESLSDYNNKGAMYGDVSDIPDFATYWDKVNIAKEQFDQLDNKVKDRFNNNPVELFNFLNDNNNKDEARKLGLLAPEIKEIDKTISSDIVQDIKTPSGAPEISQTNQ